MLLSPGKNGPPTLVRDGPDLREVEQVVGTGGAFAHRDDGQEILATALERRGSRSLAPQEPVLGVDGNYILAAAGLLATVNADAAAMLLQRELASALA
jgi:hypothetical protein